MRVLLLHPEDSPLVGPWARQKWDLVVDLGKSSSFSEERWSTHCGCPVLRTNLFWHGIEDAKYVQRIFAAGRGRLIDEQGVDWWDIASLQAAPEAFTALALVRVASKIDPSAELWATRPGWPASGVVAVLGKPVRTFESGGMARSVAHVMHYVGLARRFSPAQIKEIFLDKYDYSYRWRARFASKPKGCESPVVLVPSAYGNVSRMAAEYARLLPQQSFLLVAARQSAKQFAPTVKLEIRDLASYAKPDAPVSEIAFLTAKWFDLKADFCSCPEMRILVQAGVFESFPRWLHDGLCARDAWSAVIDREPVQAVLCGDDSNLYTRLPVLLAARKKIPTVDFHHGAFDGRYLLKDLPCDIYLTKNEMERDYLTRVCGLSDDKLMVGAPDSAQLPDQPPQRNQSTAVFFSEPYESAGMRGEEVYAEVLPFLCKVAREHGRNVMLKLHPFESRQQRSRMLDEILSADDRKLLTVIDGPLSSEILSQVWFGVTCESTVVLDCLQAGVCCFLCRWLKVSPFDYVEQFARFGVGELLERAEQLLEIPKLLEHFHARARNSKTSNQIDPSTLQRLLTSGTLEPPGLRSVS
jgi:hypothetical protein